MISWNKICGLLFFLTLSCQFAGAQNLIYPTLNNTVFFLKGKFNAPDSLVDFTLRQYPETFFRHVQKIIPADFSTCTYGFFCRKELVLENATKIPFRFRLGSLQQCNYYEGKKQ